MKWMVLACITLLVLTLAVVTGPAAAASGEKTSHFTIKYSSPPSSAPGIGKVLEDSYHAVNNLVGHLPSTIKVVVVDNDAMDTYGKHVEAFSAWNNKSSTIVLRDETLKDKKSLGVVSRHEICHLGLNNILEKKDERQYAWMEEGVCMVISNEPLDDVKVSRYIVSNGFMGLPEIAKAIDSENYSICKNGYLQSFSLSKAIAKEFGDKTLVDIIKSPEPSFESAFKKSTGMEFARFNDDWKAAVKSKAKEKPGPSEIIIHGCLNMNEAD